MKKNARVRIAPCCAPWRALAPVKLCCLYPIAQANPENTVGVLTMAGKTPRVLVTPTPDLGKILNSMQNLPIEGASKMSTAVSIAQLALKHRQNKNQRQRIVIFMGSPIAEDQVRPARSGIDVGEPGLHSAAALQLPHCERAEDGLGIGAPALVQPPLVRFQSSLLHKCPTALSNQLNVLTKHHSTSCHTPRTNWSRLARS